MGWAKGSTEPFKRYEDMIIHEFENPIPVTTDLGDGYIIYVRSNGMFENDEFCCVLKDDGSVKYFLATQIKIWFNATYGINKK